MDESLRTAVLGVGVMRVLQRLPDGFELRVVPHALDVSQVVVTVKRLSVADDQGQCRTVSHVRVSSRPEHLGVVIATAVAKLEP